MKSHCGSTCYLSALVVGEIVASWQMMHNAVELGVQSPHYLYMRSACYPLALRDRQFVCKIRHIAVKLGESQIHPCPEVSCLCLHSVYLFRIGLKPVYVGKKHVCCLYAAIQIFPCGGEYGCCGLSVAVAYDALVAIVAGSHEVVRQSLVAPHHRCRIVLVVDHV